MKRAALYIRVSTDQQKLGDSLREQAETLHEFVKYQKDMIVYSEYIDDGISGQKLQRDEFTRLISDVKSGKIDIILFTKLDRWFRNLRHYLNTQETLEKYNVSWNAVSQQYYDTSTAYGRTFIAQVMSFAELEAQIDSERIKAVMDNKIKNGEVVSGKVPFGYSIENKKLVINEKAPLIVDIFNYYNDSGSLRKTVHYMENELNLSRDYQSVKNMLTNKKYMGVHRGNENFCPPIIDKELFNSVQLKLSKNIKNNSKHTYIFTGLIRCGECSRAFSGQVLRTNYIKKDGNKSVYTRKCYRCPKHRNSSKACSNKRVVYEHTTENYLLENIQNEVERYLVDYSKTEKKINKTVDIEKKINQKLERLKKAYLNEIIELDEYKIDREKLMAELKEATKEPTPSPKDNVIMLKKIMSDNFSNIYSNMNEEDRRAIWRSFIKDILVFPDGKIEIKFL
ncbi:recombinase family protein [Enterococcus wangshanyuanii]|uniref:Integrase n=1 Tax=Enterococcus wangshanyuanii TaxID=2005703 RepID=A0ABQ1P064_9ENTE|nr:recombinase family protein [Enterococcus wangshanyuanii]GGC88362.1 integrase [Enterococcus wangshanyuanii]